jgi:hypothetical protein
MPNFVTNTQIEDCLREILIQEGFALTPKRAHGETGVDIVAKKGGAAYFIEVIGYKKAPPARAKDFFEGFFRAVSRLNDSAEHIVLALSHLAGNGLPARAKQHRIAWLRIADSFPELQIWLVDAQNRTCKETTWREWAERD